MKPGRFAIIWRYEVREEHREAFERAYGPDGDWARLFSASEFFLRTDLMVSDQGQYLTVDYWRSEEDFHAFQAQWGAEYMALDSRLEPLTESEERLGEFTLLE